MYDPQFPGQKRIQLIRAQFARTVDMSESNGYTGNRVLSQSSDRGNANADDAMAAADASGQPDEMRVHEIEIMSADVLQQLDDRVPDGYDWSEGHSKPLETALEEYSKQYYINNNHAVLHSNEGSPTLFEEEKYRPENAHKDEQAFIIFQHLLFHYRRQQWIQRGARDDEIPLVEFLFVEGLPGVGKTFVILTTRNITLVIEGRISADMASAPTGCAAKLIHGKTTCRCSDIPTGKKLQKKPSNSTSINATQVKVMRKAKSNVIYRTMDEHSMNGRATWAWIEHRHEEHRRTYDVIDAEMNTVAIDDESPHLAAVLRLPFVGIQKVATFVDHAQLPSIGMKSIYDPTPGKPGSADAHGQISIANFRFPPLDNGVEVARCTTVFMEKVLRQNNGVFLRLLQHMRDGEIDDRDVDLLQSRCWENLSQAEQCKFKHALHLTPTWKKANEIVVQYLKNDLTTAIAKF